MLCGVIGSHHTSPAIMPTRCKNSICPLVALLVPRIRFGSAAVIAIAAAGATGVLVSQGLPNRAVSYIAVSGWLQTCCAVYSCSIPPALPRAPHVRHEPSAARHCLMSGWCDCHQLTLETNSSTRLCNTHNHIHKSTRRRLKVSLKRLILTWRTKSKGPKRLSTSWPLCV
jgi:hypothetical protein